MNAQGAVGPHTPKNASPTSEVKISQMWVSANDLAKALAKFVEKKEQDNKGESKESPKVQSVEPMISSSTISVPECCRAGTCAGEKRDSPSSPDVESQEEREREWRSDTSESGEVRRPYQPEVSSVSSELPVEQGDKNIKTRQTEKRKGSRPQNRMVRRIAHIRPQAVPVRRRALLQGRRETMIPQFRMSVQAPVVQTHDVISRITLADGGVLEESMRLRCAIAEDVATQTELTMEMLAVALGENQPRYRAEEEPMEVPEIGEAVEVPVTGEVIDLTADERTDEGSEGTPVQDEHNL
jgi:hypothetical protein